MDPTSLKSFFKNQIESVKDDFIRDLTALSHEQLAACPGGKARTPYDLTFEVALVNRRIAQRMAGEDPGPWPIEGWASAPAEYQDKDQAINDFEASVDEVLTAWDSIPESDVHKEIVLPGGNKTSPIDLAFMAAYHTGYHDAQLNYVQTLHGDAEMHWE